MAWGYPSFLIPNCNTTSCVSKNKFLQFIVFEKNFKKICKKVLTKGIGSVILIKLSHESTVKIHKEN